MQLHVFPVALQSDGARFGHKYFNPGVFVLISFSDLQTFTTVAVGDVALAAFGHDYLNTTVEVETVACLGRHVAYPHVDYSFSESYRTESHFFLPRAQLSSENVSMQTALVIGGTGPTGPYVVNGLLDRGFRVTIAHTGQHETSLIGPEVEHIHTDPFDIERTDTDLGVRTFDLAVVMYGRLRDLARLLQGRVSNFVSIGGVGVYRGFANPDDLFPIGMPVPLPYKSDLVGNDEFFGKLRRIRETEEVVFSTHPTAIHLRYPQLYGPRQLLPREWPIVRRALDRRPFLIVPDGGLTVKSQAWVENAAHATLLACDRPDAAIGNIYNVADQQLFSVRQIAEIVADELDHEWEIVSLPYQVAPSTRPMLTSWSSSHRILDIGPTIQDLGYSDLVKPNTAWRLATRWLADNPIERGGEVEHRLDDPFEYASEDRQYEIWQRCQQELSVVEWSEEPGYSSAYVGRNPNPARS